MPIPSNLLDEQSLDSSGSEILGDESSNNDVNTEDSNDNTNFYISDYDYYYYDITDWVDDMYDTSLQLAGYLNINVQMGLLF